MTYRITIEHSGGATESVIGTLPKQVVDYWIMHSKDKDGGVLRVPKDAFSEYMTSYDHIEYEEENKVSQMNQLPYWHDIDNILHTNGIYGNGNANLTIYQYDFDEVIGSEPDLLFDDDADDADIRINLDTKKSIFKELRNLPYTDAVFYANTYEKMNCIYEFEIEEPFNIDKFRFVGDWHRGNTIISSALYNGEKIDHNGGEGYTKSLDVLLDYENLIRNE